MLTQSSLAKLDCCEFTVDELVALIVEVDTFTSAFKRETGMEAPEWAGDKLVAARTELKSKIRAEKQRRVAQLRQQKSVYLSREQKLAATEQELLRLERELGE